MIHELSSPPWAVTTRRSSELVDSLDEVQVKKNALIFLCRINADWEEVERFLTRYPEALLLDGDDANPTIQTVVQNQIKRCNCFTFLCNENRRKTLLILRRGFEYYRALSFAKLPEEDMFLRKVSGGGHWEFYTGELKVLERQIREMNEKQLIVTKRIVRVRSDIRQFCVELDSESLYEEKQGRLPSLKILKCQKKTDARERRLLLENHMSQASDLAKSLEEEYHLLESERLAAERLRTAILKTAFAGCGRHVCLGTNESEDAVYRDRRTI